MNVHEWVVDAYTRIKPYIRETPLEYSAYLSKLCECDVYLKLENQQVTGSFKARGGLNKILALSDEERNKGIIAASTGNHAAAIGFALDISGTTGDIYMPENVSGIKIENLKQYKNVKMILYGKDSVDSEKEALKQAELQEKVYVSPYNDQEIIGGQGTIAYEIARQLPNLDKVLVPVGGGGLISGIAGYLSKEKPDVEVISCQPVNSAVMYHSIKAGQVLDMESQPTISDGTAGGIEQGSITFPICQKDVHEYHLVEENEIIDALGILLKHHQIIAEGAGGLSIASLIKNPASYKGKKVVLVICGNKMSIELMKTVISRLD